MANKVLLKKSSVASKVPLASDLDYGELALNYADGLLYYKNSSNAIQPIGGAGGSGTVSNISTGTGLTGGPITSTGTISIDTSIVAQKSDTHYIGTTSVALNRSSANLALTGILSLTLPGSTSGSVQLIPTATAGSGTIITLPATTGTIVTTGDSATVTNTMLAGSIANSKLSNSSTTIGTTSISLGSSSTTLAGLTSVTSTSFIGALTGNADTVTNGVYTSGSYTDPTWLTINYSKLSGTVPTWNQDTTGNAATVTNGVYTSGSYSDPSWLTISKSKVGLSNVENTALSTWAGTTNITTLGTITTGAWNGTAIAPNRGGTGVANNTANTITFTGAYSLGLTLSANTSVTLPTTGTLVTLNGTETLTNKTLTSPTITAPAITGGLSTDTIATSGAAVIGTDLTVTGNLTVNGSTTTSNSTNTAYADSLIELHYSNGGTLTSNDGKDIGIRMHYYTTSDKNAALLLANDTQNLEFYADGTETNGVFSGTYGAYRGSQFVSVATTGTAPLVVSSTTRVANLNAATAGNADTVTHGVYTTDTGTVTNTMLAGSIANAKLSNSSVTVGTTSIALGASSTTLAGLTSVTSTSFVGALAGNASTATTLQTARAINGVSFDGSANVVVHTAGTGISISGTSVAVDSTVATLTDTQTLSNKSLNTFDVKTGSTTVSNNAVIQATVATTSLTPVDTFAVATYRSAKYVVQITQGSNYQVSEIMVIHNGTTTIMTEYGIMNTNGVLGTFTTDVNAGNARLLVTMGSATSATINIARTTIVV